MRFQKSNEKPIQSLFENLLVKDDHSNIDRFKMIYRVGDLVIDIKPPNYSQAAVRAILNIEDQMENIVERAKYAGPCF